MAVKPGVTIKTNGVPKLVAALKRLPRRDVLVGYPADGSEGTAGRDGGGSNLRTEQVNPKDRAISDLTNAQLAYLHEHGVPELNIPARPHLVPGVREGRGKFTPHLRKAAAATLAGDAEGADRAMHSAGLAAADAVRTKIKSGPFVPLSPRTIARRRIRSAGSSYRRKATTAADVKPLIDTAQMLRAVTYVVREAK